MHDYVCQFAEWVVGWLTDRVFLQSPGLEGHLVDQDVLEPKSALLPLPLKGWDYRSEPTHPTLMRLSVPSSPQNLYGGLTTLSSTLS